MRSFKSFIILSLICFFLFGLFYPKIQFAKNCSPKSNFIYFFKKFNINYKRNISADYSTVPIPYGAPLIIEWNGFTASSTFYNRSYYEKECALKCLYSSNRELLPLADIVTFNFGHHTLKDFLLDRNPNRMNVFISFENPEHRPFYKQTPRDYFNVTATYRLDSDIQILYDFFEPITKASEAWDEEEVKLAISKKSKPVLSLVSNCRATSKRETLINDINRHVNISRFGRCVNNICNPKCEKEAIESHYFTLAFENSDCLDYLTEKVYRIRKLIVPIILDRSILRGVHNKLSPFVIAVSDFKSTKELADYLTYLISNPDEYKKYFDWTKVYKKVQTKSLRDDLACSLCEIAWKKKNGAVKIIPDFHEWWGGNKCRTNFGENFVKNYSQLPLIYDDTIA